MSSAIIGQIRAIAEHVTRGAGGDPKYPTDELLLIRQALGEALGKVDAHLRWRREASAEAATIITGRTPEDAA